MNWLTLYGHALTAGRMLTHESESHLDEHGCDNSIENCYLPEQNVRPDNEALVHLLGAWVA